MSKKFDEALERDIENLRKALKENIAQSVKRSDKSQISPFRDDYSDLMDKEDTSQKEVSPFSDDYSDLADQEELEVEDYTDYSDLMDKEDSSQKEVSPFSDDYSDLADTEELEKSENQSLSTDVPPSYKAIGRTIDGKVIYVTPDCARYMIEGKDKIVVITEKDRQRAMNFQKDKGNDHDNKKDIDSI